MKLNDEEFFLKTLDILEKMIDNRVRYLEEKRNENHYYARSLLEKEYLPLKSELYQTIKNTLDKPEKV